MGTSNGKRKANNDYNLGPEETDEELSAEKPSMEGKIRAILDIYPDWKITFIKVDSEVVRVELAHNQFSISYRYSLGCSNCAMYEDGVENQFGVPERVRLKQQFNQDVEPDESLALNLNECLVMVLHAL